MQEPFDWKFPYPSQRMPILAQNIVSTSQPLASQAGLRMILKGGNAVDAAVAAAIALTVVEPCMNGIGSDAFVILYDGKHLVGLNASGRSPTAWMPEHFARYKKMPILGWDTVTVPGAVSAWVELSTRYGQLPFEDLFEPAIEYATKGFLVSPIIAENWKMAAGLYQGFPDFAAAFTRNGKVPKAGERFAFPALAHSLELIAETRGDTFYHGDLAKKIVAHAEQTGGSITLEDLESHKALWVKPISLNYKDVTVHELPPNGQGIAALMMLGIIKHLDLNSYKPDSIESWHLQIEAMKLAFADTYRYVADPDSLEFPPEQLLKDNYLSQRATLIDRARAQNSSYDTPPHGDTVYLTTADANGMMVSYIQSNFLFFGSGIVVPDTGISFQNRGSGFTLEPGHPNQVGPKKRPFHTIIPAFITRKDKPLISFGVMGGPMQPQGHAQMLIRIFEYGQNPQAASDAPRWCVTEGLHVNVEECLKKEIISGLMKLGHKIARAPPVLFGGAQLIYNLGDGYVAASDHRKDGQAVGF
jgi:gamma-glutamyltranspeptidase/glutathione hydrolase